MTTGLLTFHRIVNDGSIMQAYCLYHLLERMCRGGVEIIDYQPAMILLRNLRAGFSRRRPRLRVFELEKMRSQQRFLDEHARLTQRSCITDDLQVAREYVRDLGHETIVVGSDTVWDVRVTGGAPPPPNIYFLPDVRTCNRVAFAASMDRGTPEALPAGVWSQALDHVGEFDFISVRDSATRDRLVDGGIDPDRVHFVPDPTLLHDFSDIVPRVRRRPGRPLAGVAVIHPELRREATDQLARLGHDVVNMLHFAVPGQMSLPPRWGVTDRLSLHGLLDFLVTDRFHASIFTLVLGRCPVLLVEADDEYPEPSGKGRDLFGRLGLERMVWRYAVGGPIPRDLVGRFMETARELEWPPAPALARLREQGRSTLALLEEFLSRT